MENSHCRKTLIYLNHFTKQNLYFRINVAFSDVNFSDNLALCRWPKKLHKNNSNITSAEVSCDPSKKEDFYVFESTSTLNYSRSASQDKTVQTLRAENFPYKPIRTGRSAFFLLNLINFDLRWSKTIWSLI